MQDMTDETTVDFRLLKAQISTVALTDHYDALSTRTTLSNIYYQLGICFSLFIFSNVATRAS